MGHDMLVKLYDLPDDAPVCAHAEKMGFQIKRVMAMDKSKLLDFVSQNFNESWVQECENAFTHSPISCYIAVKDHQIAGFACYDVTAPNFFGPTGVRLDYRGLGLGEALLKKSLLNMKYDGYGYAIIGWVGEARGFYEKTVGARIIEDSHPGVYQNMVEK